MPNWVNAAGYVIDNGQVFAKLSSHTEVGAYVFVAQDNDEEWVEYHIDPKTYKLSGYNMTTEEEIVMDAIASPELLEFVLNHEGVKSTANPKWVDVAGFKINDNKVFAFTFSLGETLIDRNTGQITEKPGVSSLSSYNFYTLEDGHEIKYDVDPETFEITRWFEFDQTSMGVASDDLKEYLLNHPEVKKTLAELAV